jgi:hypothetical protein
MPFKKGQISPNKGKKTPPEIRKKMSDAQKGRKMPEERKLKISMSTKGKPKGEIHRKKLADHLKTIKMTEETKKKISDARKGRKMTEETKRKIGDAHRGALSSTWKGGISFEPYCPKFTKEFKERVRAFFDHKCVECGTPQNDKKLSVHHVNFNKQSCCDDSLPLFVPLCRKCHTKTNYNRIFWKYWFTEMINLLYGGKCYFTKEEMNCFVIKKGE